MIRNCNAGDTHERVLVDDGVFVWLTHVALCVGVEV